MIHWELGVLLPAPEVGAGTEGKERGEPNSCPRAKSGVCGRKIRKDWELCGCRCRFQGALLVCTENREPLGLLVENKEEKKREKEQ